MTVTSPVLKQIAGLPKLSQDELKALWKEYFGVEPPAYRRGFLVRGLARRLQELTYGGLKPAYQARLDAMIESTEKPNGTGRPGRRPRQDVHLLEGTKLLRAGSRSGRFRTFAGGRRVMTERMGLEVDTLTIRIPIRLQRRGGRKLIMTPEGSAAPTPKPRRDETLVKALVRAHRWRRQIESGRAKSITDLAEQEGVTDAYVCRLLPLTCLAPDVVEAILDGRQPKGLRLADMLGNGSVGWEEQRRLWR